MTCVSPAIRLSSVDLPQPEWPMIETNSPLSMVERDVLQHLGATAAAVEVLVDMVELEIGGHDRSPQFAAVPRVTKAPTAATSRSRQKPTTPI